jgi:hypothetical protein
VSGILKVVIAQSGLFIIFINEVFLFATLDGFWNASAMQQSKGITAYYLASRSRLIRVVHPPKGTQIGITHFRLAYSKGR